MKLRRSWLGAANEADSHFPLNNLPCCTFSRTGGPADRRPGIGIGDRIIDVRAIHSRGLLPLPGNAEAIWELPSWNRFMAAGPETWAAFRSRLTELLREGGDDALRADPGQALVPVADARLHLPFEVAEFTDFYSGRHHAFNVGTMFRGPENALPPNWLHIPIGYNGRASTVVVTGTDIRRPWGQLKPPGADAPVFAPSRRFDFELEMGAVVGQPSSFGVPVSVREADDMIFGYVLLNDWSARDIQAWEYQPLGPFQAKATATTISPWIVTKAALEPFRVATPKREKPLLPYLEEPGPMLYDIELEAALRPDGAPAATTLVRTNYRELYYSAAQQLCHHASSGCRMNVGDLLGSGTISGPGRGSRGSLLELSWGGKEPVKLDEGVERSFLEDGDTLTMTGWAEGDGYRVGFGNCEGTVKPAVAPRSRGG